ncbi:MAG: hypothetical protein ACYC23_18760, partial [Limisphaerales bacterium]
PTARSKLNLVRALFDQTQPLRKAERLAWQPPGANWAPAEPHYPRRARSRRVPAAIGRWAVS